MLTTTGPYDDALERFHRTGPEFEGYLSNHGPMVVEVLARRGADRYIDRWTDGYLRRLEPLPAPSRPIDALRWRDGLGDETRAADWIEFMSREVASAPWAEVLARWWPRLLPGIAAGATHGVIRVGHAVNALRSTASPPRIAELAHALAYWAARWQPVPVVSPAGTRGPRELVGTLPRVPRQESGIRDRLAQLDAIPHWPAQVASLVPPAGAMQVPAALDAVVDAVVEMYPRHARGNPTMLVHAATAPNAVAMALPALPPELWPASFAAAWSACAAVVSAYAPALPHDRVCASSTGGDVLDRAIAHGGAHVVKFVDVALASHLRTDSELALGAAATALHLDA